MNTLKSNSNENLAKIAKNKSLLKEYHTSDHDRVVYLNDGDEFQIQLFNPETTEVCVKISIDDVDLSHDIVLRPGERMWLDRYTDVKKKFRFDTYLVNGDNKQVSEAIKHNGEIKFSFYRRKQRRPITYVYTGPSVTWYNCADNVYDYNYYTTCDNSIKASISGINTTDCSLNLNDCISSISASAANCASSSTNFCSTITTGSASNNYTVSASTCTNNVLTKEAMSRSAKFDGDAYRNDKTIETGRIGEGSHSNQEFTEVNMDFESWAFKYETIQILPESRKPYTSRDARKLYCPNCGRKLNTKYNYCPYCGQKID